ncbi:MAG: ATP-binding protein [Anaerolineae bacterium]
MSSCLLPCDVEGGHIHPRPLRDSGFVELDPRLLATPFAVQTNWHVITGAASCGKTTLLSMLAAQGFWTVAETARSRIERELAKGQPLADTLRLATAQRAIHETPLQAEGGLRAMDVVFFDRGLPDCLYFWRLAGLDPNAILPECFRRRYASVFILDRLLLQLDGARVNDDVHTDLLDDGLVRVYGALGYDVVRVPVLSRQDRVPFILEGLSEQRLI